MKRHNNTTVGHADSKRIGVIILSLALIAFAPLLHAETRYKVRSSDNLSRIIDRFYKDRTLTKAQIMVSILERNPRAFKQGNINFLLKGRKLILPDENEMEIVSQDDALLILADQALKAEEQQERAKQAANNPLLGINTDNNDQLSKKQEKQSKKISQLEQQSKNLRKQLELLVKEKGQRDKKLQELEQAMKESLVNNNSANPLSASESSQTDNTKAVIKTKTDNSQQLIQSQTSEKTEKPEAPAKKPEPEKGKTTPLQKAEKAPAPVSTLQDSKDTPELNKDSNKTTPVLPSIATPSNSSDDKENSLSTKLIWLLPLILLGLFWYLLKQLKGNRRKQEIPDEDLKTVTAAYLDNNENLNPDFHEPSLETDLKLNLAKAYIDIGDLDEAENLLTEVMNEGDNEQKELAQQIKDKITDDL